MKKCILLIVCLCTAGKCFPQCYFYNTYDYIQRNDAASTIIQTNDGNFISIGQSDELIGIGDGTYVVKTDECGNVLWKSFSVLSPGGGGETPWKGFESTIDNSILLFGTAYDPGEGAASAFLFKLNANGDSIYFKIINHGYNDWCFSAIKNNENEFILGGDYNLAPPGKRVFLSKVDSLGNIIWKYDYGDTLDGYGMKNIDKTQDGGYIIGGYLNYGPTGATGSLYLIKTDSAGSQQWEKHYPSTYYQGHVLATTDGGYLLVGNQKPSSGVYWGYVGKMDSAGNVQWQKYFDQPGEPGVFTNAKQLADGNYIVEGTIANTPSGATASIYKISQFNGDVIWKREYNYFGGSSDNYLYDLIISTEGDIVGTGYIIPGSGHSTTANDMVILKIDSCGYLENQNINAAFTFTTDTTNKTVSFTNQSTEYCTALWYFGDGDSTYNKTPTHTYTADGIYYVTLIVRAGNSLDTFQQQIAIFPVGVSEYSNQESEIGIYPNPVNETLRISIFNSQYSLHFIAITDMSGKQILQTTQTEIPVSHLTKGLYFVRVEFTNGQSAVRKVVIQ